MIDRLDVHIEIDGESVQAGAAFFAQRRGAPVSTVFSYSASYLAFAKAIAIDPNLPLIAGSQASDRLPGAFQDCAPDRWGRNLIVKRARSLAVGQAGRVPSLNDVDFLAGVSDFTRQGALRFTLPGSTTFLDPDITVPKLIALPHLLHAVDRLADDEDDEVAIKALLDAGSGSLGGARPKASVLDTDGRLLMAKFPHRNDRWDIMGWEKTALDIAERAGIDVPGRRLAGFDGRHVLLLERFDRKGDRRVPYISSITLTNGRDGEDHDYADIATFLADSGSRVDADLVQLFRRSALNCAIHNTDDHLRNHGFLGSASGWRLSQVFDINPNPDLSEGRQTSVGTATHADEEVSGLLMFASTCRLSDNQAHTIVAEVLDATAGWADMAAANGISPREQNRFRPMFDDRREALAEIARGTSGTRRPPQRGGSATGEQDRLPAATPHGGRFTSKNSSHGAGLSGGSSNPQAN
jgi:serine/threonine-protein kinase HipA